MVLYGKYKGILVIFYFIDAVSDNGGSTVIDSCVLLWKYCKEVIFYSKRCSVIIEDLQFCVLCVF